MAKTKIEVDVILKGGESVEQVENKTKSLKAQLKEMKALLASGTLDSNSFNKLAAEAGALEDQIGDVSQRVKNLASDSKGLDGVISLAQGLVGGFSAVQGVTAMLGTDNEELQATMVKLQGSMTALAGIQAVVTSLNKDSALMTSFTTVKTYAQAIANKFLTATTMESVAATYALRAALIASGIGAIVVLIGVAVSAMDKFTDSTNASKKATDDLAESQEMLKNALLTTSEELTQHDKFNIERSKLRGDAVSTQIKIEQDALQTQLYLGQQDIKRILDARSAYKKNSEEYKKLDLEREERGRKNVAILNDLEFSKERYQFALDKEAQDRKDKKDEKDKKSREKQKELDDKVAKQREEDRQNEIIWERELDEYKVDRFKKVRAIDTENMKKEQDKRLFALGAYNRAVLDSENTLADAKRNALEAGFNIANQFTGKNKALADTLFAIQKGVAIAQIVIDTQKEIAGYYSNPTWKLLPDGGLSLATTYSAGAKIRAATSIAAIGATTIGKFMGGGGSGSVNAGDSGGGSGSMSSQPPRLDTYQTNRIPMNANQRVYVLEKDITDSQGRVARIRHNATLI
jgi:hypothetical protein